MIGSIKNYYITIQYLFWDNFMTNFGGFVLDRLNWTIPHKLLGLGEP